MTFEGTRATVLRKHNKHISGSHQMWVTWLMRLNVWFWLPATTSGLILACSYSASRELVSNGMVEVGTEDGTTGGGNLGASAFTR